MAHVSKINRTLEFLTGLAILVSLAVGFLAPDFGRVTGMTMALLLTIPLGWVWGSDHLPEHIVMIMVAVPMANTVAALAMICLTVWQPMIGLAALPVAIAGVTGLGSRVFNSATGSAPRHVAPSL